MRMLPIMMALDANQDGRLSAEEIANATAALKTLDKNADGQLTMEELRPAPPRDGDFPRRGQPDNPEGRVQPQRPEALSDQPNRPEAGRGRPDSPEARRGQPDNPEARAQFMARMFEQRDADKDGKLSGDEIPPQMAGRLEQLDTDGDKAISKAEMQAMMGRFGAGARGREGDQPGRPGGDRPRRPQPEAE
jgi:hypothetical protein